jgi:cupin fold WbuC family metalloprotein
MIKLIDEILMGKLTEKAKQSDRLRTHYNLHSTLEDPIHRLCIAAEPNTYMRPHRHQDKWELLILLKGKASLILFDDSGTVIEKFNLSEEGTSAIEIQKGVWHVFYSEKSGTILLEVKAGPYIPISSEDSAPWAPQEGNDGTMEMLEFYKSCLKNQKKA